MIYLLKNRFYAKRYQDYREIFGNIAYAESDVNEDEQITFFDFLNKVALKDKEERIKDKYHFLRNNCYSFTLYAIKVLKPDYRPKDIKLNGKNKLSGGKRESILPSNIIYELKSPK